MPTAPILTMGARWKAEDVYWRSAPKNAKPLAVEQKAINGPIANFAQQTGIYVLYADFVPVYVGQANKTLWARLRMHMNHDDLAGRWDRFTWFGFRRVVGGEHPKLSLAGAAFHISAKQLLDHLEATLIHAFEPAMNGQKGRFGEVVVRYRQVRDDRLGPSDRRLLETIAVKGKLLPDGKKVTKRGWKTVV